jgi:hypothetical protein
LPGLPGDQSGGEPFDGAAVPQPGMGLQQLLYHGYGTPDLTTKILSVIPEKCHR